MTPPTRKVIGNSNKAVPTTQNDLRLNKLITDYRAENERCTKKINELKKRLVDGSTEPVTRKQRNNTGVHITPGSFSPSSGHQRQEIEADNKIYAKSFKVIGNNQ